LRFDFYDTPTENLNIVAVEGAEVSNIYASLHDGAKITNLYIANIEFFGQGVHSNNTDIDGLTVENCQFKGIAGVGFGNNDVKNIVVKYCAFDLNTEASSGQTAIYIHAGIDNLLIENCTFKNIPYNALQANAENSGKVEGNIVIKNNNFESVGSRVLYIKFIICNHRLKGCHDRIYLLSITFKANTYDTAKSVGRLFKFAIFLHELFITPSVCCTEVFQTNSFEYF
jgi:hypothetical protein